MTPDHQQQAITILQRINELAAITEAPGIITRVLGTDAFIKGRSLVAQWMQQAGLQTRIDAIGNVRGRLSAAIANAKTLVIGSHIDTVVNAGKFDGPLGVLTGIALLQQLKEQRIRLPFHLELIAFCDEEGCRFHTTYLGSKVVAGQFDNTVFSRLDSTGISLQEVIQSMGCDPSLLLQDAIAPGDWLGYFEIHIEQGPVLYEKNIPVGIVTAIAGQKRVALTFTGEAGHAGTVPMHMRKDALCAAAEFIQEVERFAATHLHPIVATIGMVNVAHAASNVIPGEVHCTLDLRCANQQVLNSCYQHLEHLGMAICQQRQVELLWQPVQEANAIACNGNMNRVLAQAVQQAGYEPIYLASGAGHDAVAIAPVAPVCMLFVRCYKGISHNPQEDVALNDIAAALHVANNFINNLIQKYNKA